MKKGIKIKECLKFEKVVFYSLTFEDEEENEYRKFEHFYSESEYKESLETIRYWLAIIGDRRSARKELFRNENLNEEERHKNSKALPPNSEYTKLERNIFSTSIEENLDLRLYCVWVSSSVVILYNGANKTARLARDCSKCKPFFYNINDLSSQLHNKSNEYEVEDKRIKKISLLDLKLKKIINE